MRPYDRRIDQHYWPDDTPDLFLTEEQVDEVLRNIPLLADPKEIDVRHVIVTIEKINREEKLGVVSTEESIMTCRKISNDFLSKHSVWPYKTKTYDSFYKSFDN
jgi:hypothetical protein